MISLTILIALVAFCIGHQSGRMKACKDGVRKVVRDLEALLEILDAEKNPEGWDRMVQRMYQFARDVRNKK